MRGEDLSLWTELYALYTMSKIYVEGLHTQYIWRQRL